jgi:cobalt-zinc-cadmium efflux system membrane fusion protein
MLKLTYFIPVALLAAVTISSCYKDQEKEQTSPTEKKAINLTKVTTYTTISEPVTQSIRLNGQIEYNPNQVVRYASLVNGLITKTNFSLGDKVSKGQVLAEIRSSELTDLTSQKRTLESRLTVAKRAQTLAESMFNDRMGSERELVEAQSEVDVIGAEIDKIRDNLALYNASSEKGVFQIKAPVSGYVVESNISTGTQISGSDSDLFTISDLSDVWITTNVYAVDLPFVKKGMKAVIKSKAYPDETFEGVISEISQVFDPQERVLKARIRMPNKDLKLKPGLTIEAVVRKDASGEAVGVPAKALIFYNNENYLLIQKPDLSLEPRKVTIHVKDNDRVFIKDSIVAGEKVVTDNQLLLFSEIIDSGK